jgi:hypothetical protein
MKQIPQHHRKRRVLLFFSACLAILWLPALLNPAAVVPPAGKAVDTRVEEPSGNDAVYMAGQLAFRRGNDEEAADLLIRAVRGDWHCLAMMRDNRFQLWISLTPCAENPGLVKPDTSEDPGPEALYRLALVRKNQARQKQMEEGAVRKAGEFFLTRLVRDFSESSWADKAALLLLDDGLCIEDEGYPGCLAWEIQGLETWLSMYNGSDLRSEVLKRTTQSYLELANRYEEPKAWNSPVKAELCRGRAIQMALLLARDYPGSENRNWANETVLQINASGKPYSMVPAGILEQ